MKVGDKFKMHTGETVMVSAVTMFGRIVMNDLRIVDGTKKVNPSFHHDRENLYALTDKELLVNGVKV